jgi:hypothetical protein
MVESVWRRRLRWRLRGAWQWPAFAMLTAVDAALVAWLPFSGGGADALGAVLFAGFVNLLAVAVLAPFVGMALRRRRRDLPLFIARDYAGTALLVAITAGFVVGGLWHRSALAAEREDREAVFVAVHKYLLAEEPDFAPYASGLDARLLEPDSYRACVSRPEERLPLCFFVNTDQVPAGIRRDPARAAN